MRFREFKLLETLNTTISADHLDGLKDVIARRIRSLPDDQTTAKALKDIEDLLQHLGSGGRIGSIGKELADVKDSAVDDAKKVLGRLVLSIAEELNASPEQKEEFFRLWKADQIVNVETIIDPENRGVSLNFNDVFNGYSSNPLMTEFINEVMTVAELGMGRGEFGLNVLSKSITVSKGGKKEETEDGGSKKGDLQFIIGGKTYQIELKTEQGGAARFGDQEVRPAEGFEAAAVALNNYVKKHKLYKGIGFTLSGSGMNLNQAIQFHQALTPADRSTFLGMVRKCLTLIFGNLKSGRKDHLMRLKRNINEIMDAIEVGRGGQAAQAYSQASFNFYMSRKHDDGVLYTNLNNKTFVYYDDAAQLLAAGLRFHASTPYISATKDPVRAVYPQISVQSTTFGGEKAQKGLKQLSKGKNPFDDPEFASKIQNWTAALAAPRGVKNKNTLNKISIRVVQLMGQKMPTDQIITTLELEFPELAVKVKTTPKLTPRAPAKVSAPAPAGSVPKTMAPTPQQPAQTQPAPTATV